jgi:CheY-like chemotaxis protein
MPQNEVLKVEANSDQLARALSNLLSAAAHACQEGETGAKELTIVLRKDERDVVLEIGDGRYGGHVPRGEDVLKPFWGVPSGEKGPPLGFLLCATLIASFGGQLLVGRGHYAVRLPAATGTVKRPRTTLLAAVPSSPEVRQARILLVDDEPQVRQMVGRMLRPREVTLVGSAIEAQARIDRGDRFEAILSDVNMPHMTGMDLHAWLVTHHPGQARCMAFMTGSMSPKLQAFLERIRAHCLLKPFGKQEIHQIVDDLIASHQLPCTAPWER